MSTSEYWIITSFLSGGATGKCMCTREIAGYLNTHVGKLTTQYDGSKLFANNII